jgi:predicted amidohydrolase YtcJ
MRRRASEQLLQPCVACLGQGALGNALRMSVAVQAHPLIALVHDVEHVVCVAPKPVRRVTTSSSPPASAPPISILRPR